MTETVRGPVSFNVFSAAWMAAVIRGVTLDTNSVFKSFQVVHFFVCFFQSFFSALLQPFGGAVGVAGLCKRVL